MRYIIIGNGVAGITAARHIRQRDPAAHITIISKESKYFFSRTALMYVFTGDMTLRDTEPYERRFYHENRLNLLQDQVTGIDTAVKTVFCESAGALGYDKLLIASGSRPHMAGWPGQDLDGVVNFCNISDLRRFEAAAGRAREAVVVGGGLIGVEMAEILARRKIRVTFLIREPWYFPQALSNEEGGMVLDHMREHGVQPVLNDETQSFEGEGGRICEVRTKAGRRLPCQICGIAVGVTPNVGFLSGSGFAVERGVLVNEYLETAVPGVYAAGDCAELSWKDKNRPGRVEQIWYTAKMQGEVAGRNMVDGRFKYDRGIWYNSAKFFDIDFHTFGLVNHQLPGEENSYFRVPGKNQSLRIVHRDGKVIGFNLLGVRFRDAVCRQWIHEERSLTYVLERLDQAWFEPEFSMKNLVEAVHA
jgi:NAD(P)H-nitrite reductase large subunit